MNYNHNNFAKKEYEDEIKEYIVNINSKDRDLIKYPNPFNFRTTFKKYVAKDYYPAHNRWNTSVVPNQPPPVGVLKTYNKVDANIQADYKNIKKIDLKEIMCPRYIPTKHPGKRINNVTVVSKSSSDSGTAIIVPFPGYHITSDNTTMTLIDPTGEETTIIKDYDIVYIIDSDGYFYFHQFIVDNDDNNIVIVPDNIKPGKYTLYNLTTVQTNIKPSTTNVLNYDAAANTLEVSNTNLKCLLPNTHIILSNNATDIRVLKIVSPVANDKVNVIEVFSSGSIDYTYIYHVNFSVLDLGEEKLITVKVNELTFPKETATNTIQSEALGTLFPTTISQTNVCYTGLSHINYNFRNLNKFNILTISLYDKNGNLLADNVFPQEDDLYDYFKIYDKYQINYVFLVKEVARNF